jgi:hypothetical protein
MVFVKKVKLLWKETLNKLFSFMDDLLRILYQ